MSDKAPIFVCGPVRSPIGKFGGGLSSLMPADLSVPVATAALAAAGAQPEQVDETIWGHGRQAGGGPNTARQVSIRAGIPKESTAYTVNKACGSSLFAIVQAARTIRLGEGEVILAGGVESMSNTPYLLPRARWGYRMGHAELVDGMYQDGFFCPLSNQLMGLTAETLAEQYDISRDEQDAYAVESQRRAGSAWDEGAFSAEVVPIEVPGRKGPTVVDRDEHMRPTTTVDKLAKLKPVFKDDGSVHPGNSSGVTDGASAVVVASASAVERHGLRPIARVSAWQSAGVGPEVMGLGPVPATQALLERTGLTLSDIDLVELNEAFAAQVIACDRELHLDRDRLNVHGGSIALGHPIGATGCRIAVTLLHAMRRREAQRGLATLCISGGMGLSVLFDAA
ncbi:MAG TPA: acetyl-CoA C-acyltransferase [Deltaproteobacteria bacterium]|nr:acetyl-CoA C-acyltransferase [Deltaproteobacteria bacterium]HCP48332.1 acetyl-CoA C-acyltransferase [Deltaproteobacteria bacterium]